MSCTNIQTTSSCLNNLFYLIIPHHQHDTKNILQTSFSNPENGKLHNLAHWCSSIRTATKCLKQSVRLYISNNNECWSHDHTTIITTMIMITWSQYIETWSDNSRTGFRTRWITIQNRAYTHGLEDCHPQCSSNPAMMDIFVLCEHWSLVVQYLNI